MSRRPVERSIAMALIALAAAALSLAAAVGDGAPAVAGPLSPTAALVGRPADAQASLKDRRPGPVHHVQLEPVVPAGRAAVSVPILMYHYIRINPDPRDAVGFDLSVTPADFAAQMDWLAANGYHPIDLDDLRGYLLGGGVLPDRPVVLTFDDGYRDFYTTAYPILRAHGFKAVSYVVPGFFGSGQYVTPDQVVEMDAHGIEIAAHTVSHVDLTAVSPAELWHQVNDSKVILEAVLGHPVLDFCYPYGRYNAAVERAVQTAGFITATTTQPGRVHSAADRFLWSRVRLSGGETLPQFVAGLGPPESSALAPQAVPTPTPLHGPPKGPVTVPLLPPRAALPAAPPLEGTSP
jgi:peptidoglycan/xylan/chitin deacetylase (PgdA/CDA1 family)